MNTTNLYQQVDALFNSMIDNCYLGEEQELELINQIEQDVDVLEAMENYISLYNPNDIPTWFMDELSILQSKSRLCNEV